MAKPLHQRRLSEKGAALIEFALAVPILILVLIGLIEFGRLTYFSIMIGNAAHAGAQYGSQNPSAGANISAMQAAAIADGQNSIANLTAANVQAQDVCSCWNGTSETPWPPSASACGQNCTTGGRQVTYAQVTVTANITPLFNLGILGVSQWTVARTATIRVLPAQN